MTMATVDSVEDMARAEDARIVHMSSGAASAIVKSEVEAQLDAAHKYRRSITAFLEEAKSMACISPDVARSCIYTLPRGGKDITGPSVRLAEICASAYGNLQIAARVLDAEEREIAAQGAAWDMQKNLRCTIEVRRRITNKSGQRYNDDMVTMTGNAAASIALRNAIFRVIPRAYVDTVYEHARRVAVGDVKSLSVRRAEVLARFAELGVSTERVLRRLELKGVADIGIDELTTLIGLGTAITDGSLSIDQAFPEPLPAPAPAEQDGKRMSLSKKGKGKQAESTPDDDERAAIEAEGGAS